MIIREFNTGVMIGLICMIVIAIIIPIFYSNLFIGLIVGVSILCTFSVSAVIGAVIPIIINKLKIDSVIASSTFLTTITELIGLFFYFSIYTSLLDILS